MSFTVTDEAVKALANMAVELESKMGEIQKAITALKTAYDDNKAGLGYHSDSIAGLLEDLEQTGEEANIPVKKLVLKLQRAALIRSKHREENVYSKGMGGRSR